MTRVRLGLVVENDAPFVFEEARALRDAGVDVRVVSVFRPLPPERWRERFGGPVAYPGRGLAGWAGAVLPGARRPARLAGLLARARAEGAPVRLVALAAAVAARARREGWTHLHASFATFPAFVAAAAAPLAGLPWSFTAHAYDVQEPRPWLPRLLREACFARAISRETAARLAAQLADAKDAPHVARVRVGHLGVDETRFAPAAHRREPGAVPRIVAVANPGPTKGLEDLVEAAAILHRAGVRLRLEILGGGPGRAALQARVDAHGLGGAVRLRGALARDAVADTLRGATLFALPCVALPPAPGRPAGRHDGLPVAILEAMATGLPVVTTAVGGIPDAIAHDETGWCVPPGDPPALARELRQLLGDPARRARLGAAARREVLARFRLRAAAARLAAWIEASGTSGPARAGGSRAAAAGAPPPPRAQGAMA